MFFESVNNDESRSNVPLDPEPKIDISRILETQSYIPVADKLYAHSYSIAQDIPVNVLSFDKNRVEVILWAGSAGVLFSGNAVSCTQGIDIPTTPTTMKYRGAIWVYNPTGATVTLNVASLSIGK